MEVIFMKILEFYKRKKKLVYWLLIIMFSLVESYLVLDYPQFGKDIGAYQFKYVTWDEKENQYCYTYKDINYRRVRIWSDEKSKSDNYRVVMPNNEEVLVSQAERKIIFPAREGVTDFDHYKEVMEKQNYNILKRTIENKYTNYLPQNILFLVFIIVLNASFSAMIIFPEKVRVYKKLVANSIENQEKQKKNYNSRRIYQLIGIFSLLVILYACIRQ